MNAAILMLSFGDRPWAKVAFETVKFYSKKIGAEAFLIENDVSDEEFSLGEFLETERRKNKRAYALKTYFAWKYLDAGFDRVAVIDDSCSIHPRTPPIFAAVPNGCIGYTLTSNVHAAKSFEMISDFQRSRGEKSITLDAGMYGNSGVVVYDRSMIDSFSPDRIIDARDLLYNDFPHQTLLYYLVMRAAVPVHILPKSYNRMPGMSLGKAERKNLLSVGNLLDREEFFITHYSGLYRNRDKLIVETSEKFIQAWRGGR